MPVFTGNADVDSTIMGYAPRQRATYSLGKALGNYVLKYGVPTAVGLGAVGAGYAQKSYSARSNRLRGSKTTFATPVTLVPKRKLRRIKPKKSMKAKVKQIEKNLKADQAYHTYKSLYDTSLLSTVGECNYTEIAGITASFLEGAMSNLRYYNPSAPGTLVTANASTGTYSRQVHIKNVNATCILRNNYQIPCRIRIYAVTPKGDTNISPLTYYENGITDQVISGGDRNTAGLYPTEIEVFKEQWTVKTLKNILLQPGKETKVSYNSGSFDYDPSVYDSHTLAYQKKFKSFVLFARIEGVLGHDTAVVNENALMSCGVDIDHHIKVQFIYDAGVNLNDIYISDVRNSSFTNGGVITSKPVADNIGYSVS